jgi:uncharacterized protein
MTAETILHDIEQSASHLKRYGVKRLGLFGSIARNEQHDQSDIDLLVEFEAGQKTFDHYMDLKFYLEDLLRHGVDLVIADAIKHRLRPSIMRDVRYAAGL